MSTDKIEATRLADHIDVCEIDNAAWLLVLMREAAALLRRWPDAKPFGRVTVRRLSQRFANHHDQYAFYPWDQPPYLDNVDECHVVYTAPPDQSERIAALEAALGELVALKDLKERIEAADASTYSLSDASAAQALADEYDRRKAPAWQAARAALRAIGEVSR